MFLIKVYARQETYSEKLFTSFYLSDRVSKCCFYRSLLNALGLYFVYALNKKYYGKEGKQRIDPVAFFKLILIGYLENRNSFRKIILHSRLRLDIQFFQNYNIDNGQVNDRQYDLRLFFLKHFV